MYCCFHFLNYSPCYRNKLQRGYAFERSDIPNGEHYVLKVNYPFKVSHSHYSLCFCINIISVFPFFKHFFLLSLLLAHGIKLFPVIASVLKKRWFSVTRCLEQWWFGCKVGYSHLTFCIQSLSVVAAYYFWSTTHQQAICVFYFHAVPMLDGFNNCSFYQNNDTSCSLWYNKARFD